MYSVAVFSIEYSQFLFPSLSLFSRTSMYQFYNPKGQEFFNTSHIIKLYFPIGQLSILLNTLNDSGTFTIFQMKSKLNEHAEYATENHLERNTTKTSTIVTSEWEDFYSLCTIPYLPNLLQKVCLTLYLFFIFIFY